MTTNTHGIVWNDLTGEPVCTVEATEQKRRAEMYDDLLAALKPFAEFARVLNDQPLRGLDDVIYSVRIGDEEAELRVSDCVKARAAIARAEGGE